MDVVFEVIMPWYWSGQLFIKFDSMWPMNYSEFAVETVDTETSRKVKGLGSRLHG